MPREQTALITGLTGQDGSFLAELLLDKGYEVTGLMRGDPERSLGCSEHLRGRVRALVGELRQPATLRAAIEQVRPAEVYHLAAPSFVPASWDSPGDTTSAIVGSCAAILEVVRDLDDGTRVYVSASGAMFGDAQESPQREDTPCRPTSPYAIAKLAAHQLVGAVRAHDGLHASSGIVYNHESERRPEQFVTRRVTRAAAAISLGLQQELVLGSLHAMRDWSYAGDIVYGAWLMLQQDRADDYVLASGVGRTVGELAATAFACVGLDAERFVREDAARVRPEEQPAADAREPVPSVGDPSRAQQRLGWAPRVGFEELVQRMVAADLRSLRASAIPS